MDRRAMIAAIAVLAVAGVCLVPAVSDESDAVTQDRFADYYVMHGTVTKTEYLHTEWVSSNFLYFAEGSVNHSTMQAYLRDQTVDVSADDRDGLGDLPVGTVIHVYYISNYEYTDAYTFGTSIPVETVLEPYTLTFFVKAGDTFTISVQSCVDNWGNTVVPYITERFGSVQLNQTYTAEYTSSTEVKVFSDTYCLYVDISYVASGASSPNGSAAAYVAVCAVITVIVLGLLVMAGMKPKWSK